MAWLISLNLARSLTTSAAEEGIAVFQCRLIDDHSCALGLDALHNTLNRTLTEVIAVALHGQTIHTDGHWLFLVLHHTRYPHHSRSSQPASEHGQR